MTAIDLSRIAEISAEVMELEGRIESLKREKVAIFAACDHHFPNGEDARVQPLVGGHENACQICHRLDC